MHKNKEIFIVGFALFSMFFGAGNLILPPFLGVWGVWIAFPIADVMATLLTGYYLNREVKNTLIVQEELV